MKHLLDRGAEVGIAARNAMNVQPLHAAVAARSPEAVAMLLARGADVNARQQVGYTPLMGAASGGRDDLVDLLLQHGADPSLASEDGKTAATIAAEHGHTAIAAKLGAARSDTRGTRAWPFAQRPFPEADTGPSASGLGLPHGTRNGA